jgi:ABC-type cobalamin/Fe3+-siderophores transport system ATPase subunit
MPTATTSTTSTPTPYTVSDLQADLLSLLKNNEVLLAATPVTGFDVPWVSTIDIQGELNDLAQWISHTESDYAPIRVVHDPELGYTYADNYAL